MRLIKPFVLLMIIATLETMNGCQSTTEKETTDGYPVYHGNDLGVNYTRDKTTFRIWAPSASEIIVRIYDQGIEGNMLESHNMKADKDGT